MELKSYVTALNELRRSTIYPNLVTTDQLQEWVTIAQTTPDFWFRTQLAQLFGELHPNEAPWGSIVLGWLVDAARRKSWWTDELLVLALRGWPQMTLESTMVLVVIDAHPLGAASGIMQAIQRRALLVDNIPSEWITGLREALARLEKDSVRQVVALLEKELTRIPIPDLNRRLKQAS